MQKNLMDKQNELAEKRLEGSASGGMVKVIMTGEKEVVDITINPEVVNPEDVEMLQDLILTAIKEATHKVKAISEAQMKDLTGGLKIPGLF